MKVVKRTIDEYRVNQAEIAELLGLSAGRISQLVSAGVFDRGDDGLFDVSQVVIAYERVIWQGVPGMRDAL
jgi:predicted XRE-type DNA-binding protein